VVFRAEPRVADILILDSRAEEIDFPVDVKPLDQSADGDVKPVDMLGDEYDVEAVMTMGGSPLPKGFVLVAVPVAGAEIVLNLVENDKGAALDEIKERADLVIGDYKTVSGTV
jgi:hypothetical protein